MKPSPIKVINAATGEVVAKVPANHFARKMPPRPKVDDPGVWAAYWSAHACCLTREERSKLAEGRSEASLRPSEFEPRWEVGDVLEVSSGLTAEVAKLTRTLEGHVTHFRLIDHRSWFMKATMGASGTPVVDEQGYPVPISPGELERSRIDGAYTRSASEGLRDGGDVLDDKLHQRLHAEASMGNAMNQIRGRKRVTKLRLEEALAEATRKNRKRTAKMLERRLKAMGERKAA